MRISRNAGSQVPSSWTVKELGSFYVEHRPELVAHANRILKDAARAEEVIQEALMKVILAAPELNSRDHALAYLHRCIENLCIDLFRHEGRRPNLVLIDDVTAELEASWSQQDDIADELTKIEDAAIVRQALALLSHSERAALVMWEVEGRSTEEIATELGVSTRTVRHTVSRARASLRRVLAELVIDEDRGLTALDLLSSTYRKTSELAKKSAKVSLSLVLVFFAFLGFNSMPSNVGISNLISQETPQVLVEFPSVPREVSAAPTSESLTPGEDKAVKEEGPNKKELMPKLKFPGLNKAGVPVSFTAADSSGGLGSVYFRERPTIAPDLALVSGQVLKTQSGAANILISQTIGFDAGKPSYSPTVSFGQAGAWVPLEVKVTSSDMSSLPNGNYLLTFYIAVESIIESPIEITATANGRDLAEAPRQVITRLVLDPSKTQVLAQAVYVVEHGASA